MTRLVGIHPNLSAFLDMLAVSEGTSTIKASDDGYNVLVGGKLFDSYAEHPNIVVELSPTLKSTAAGRYQLLYRFWPPYRTQLVLPDFGPESQDKIALQLIRECKATSLLIQGELEAAIAACASRWASLPGAGYGQRENKIEALLDVYQRFGGIYA